MSCIQACVDNLINAAYNVSIVILVAKRLANPLLY